MTNASDHAEARARGTTLAGLQALREQGFDSCVGAAPGRVADRLCDIEGDLARVMLKPDFAGLDAIAQRLASLRLACDAASAGDAMRFEGDPS